MHKGQRRVAIVFSTLATMVLVVVGNLSGQFGLPPSSQQFIPNGTSFLNPGGTSQTFSTVGGGIDQTGLFPSSKVWEPNDRSLAQPATRRATACLFPPSMFHLRFALETNGLDPIFRTVDGSNCNHNIDVSTVGGRFAAYSLLRTRGLIRIAIAVPANANYAVTAVKNPYACNETSVISQYRRPLPSTNLPFLSTVMWDGRESSPLTGTTKIIYSNYPSSLQSDLAHQAVDATTGHAQGDGTRPAPAEQQQIVNFEMALFTAQSTGLLTGPL